MRDDGVRRALAFVTSAFGSYSGCRQYIENIEQARAAVGDGAPRDRQDPALFNTSQVLESDDGPRPRGARRTSVGTLGFHGAFRAGGHGAIEPYVAELKQACAAVAAGVGPRRLEPGLSEPQRAACRSRGSNRISCDYLRELPS